MPRPPQTSATALKNRIAEYNSPRRSNFMCHNSMPSRAKRRTTARASHRPAGYSTMQNDVGATLTLGKFPKK